MDSLGTLQPVAICVAPATGNSGIRRRLMESRWNEKREPRIVKEISQQWKGKLHFQRADERIDLGTCRVKQLFGLLVRTWLWPHLIIGFNDQRSNVIRGLTPVFSGDTAL